MLKKATIAMLFLLIAGGNKTYAQDLNASTSVLVNGSTWNYTISNNQPNGDTNFLDVFSLQIVAPVSSIMSPIGWAALTDNVSYILWYNTDPTLPYPHDVAPGASLAGFSFQSAPYELGSTLSTYSVLSDDHSTDSSGPENDGTVLVPSVPEASTVVSLGAGLLVLGGLVLIARRRVRKTAGQPPL